MLPANLQQLLATAPPRNILNLRSEQLIEDALPCTPVQEGLMELAVKEPGSHTSTRLYRLQSGTDVARFKAAWGRTVGLYPGLRSRIALVENTFVQVQVGGDVEWTESDARGDPEALLRETEGKPLFSLGTRLNKYAVSTAATGDAYFRWTFHHSVFDDWSADIVLDTLSRAYEQAELPAVQPYRDFISHVRHLDGEKSDSYWRGQLEGCRPSLYPPRNINCKSSPQSLLTRTIDFSIPGTLAVSESTVLRAAWSLVLARYHGGAAAACDVTFGAIVSGRDDAALAGCDRIAAATSAAVPVRICVDPAQALGAFLDGIQAQAAEMVPFQQHGLQNIAKLGDEIREVCELTSLLVVQPGGDSAAGNPLLIPWSLQPEARAKQSGFSANSLTMNCAIGNGKAHLSLSYDAQVLSDGEVNALAAQYSRLVGKLLAASREESLSQFMKASDEDLHEVIQRNSVLPRVYDTTIHAMVEQHAEQTPDALAVEGRDKQFTYQQLNEAANRISKHLIKSFDIQVGDVVVLCFEKSAWSVVAMLAVIKAGATWAFVHPSQSQDYKQKVVKQTGALVVIASLETALEVMDLDEDLDVVELTAALDKRLSRKAADSKSAPDTDVTPEGAAFITFAPGADDGVPQGVVVEHRAAVASCAAAGDSLGLDPKAKMLQHASLDSSSCIGEIFGALLAGACVCIPSEGDATDGLAKFIKEFQVTCMSVGPSLLRTVEPKSIPSVNIICISGEPVGQDVVETWYGKTRLFHAWGSAETGPFAAVHEYSSSTDNASTMRSSGGGGLCWIVAAQDSDQLAPAGTVGEVIIQGPCLFKEHLGQDEKTAAAFVAQLPSWMPHRDEPQCGRAFKSGELACYTPEGAMVLANRKVAEARVGEVHVDTAKIESQLLRAMPKAKQVVVTTARSSDGNQLVAYFGFSHKTVVPGADAKLGSDNMFVPVSKEIQDQVASAAGKLSVVLPKSMVPKVFICAAYFPVDTSFRIDRHALKVETEALDEEKRSRFTVSASAKRAPKDGMESRLQKLWSEILGVATEQIGRDDSFLTLGGDSITALRLESRAHLQGLTIAVSDMFKDPRLCAMAEAAVEEKPKEQSKVEETPTYSPPKQAPVIKAPNVVTAPLASGKPEQIRPFSLIPPPEPKPGAKPGRKMGSAMQRMRAVATAVQEQCNLDSWDDIEDAFPCTALQEGFMALSQKNPGSYINRNVFKIGAGIDVGRFRDAWEMTLQACPNMRTRFVIVDDRNLQAVIQVEPRWEETDGLNLRRYMDERANTVAMGYGQPLTRYAMVQEGSDYYFIWFMHHATPSCSRPCMPRTRAPRSLDSTLSQASSSTSPR